MQPYCLPRFVNPHLGLQNSARASRSELYDSTEDIKQFEDLDGVETLKVAVTTSNPALKRFLDEGLEHASRKRKKVREVEDNEIGDHLRKATLIVLSGLHLTTTSFQVGLVPTFSEVHLIVATATTSSHVCTSFDD